MSGASMKNLAIFAVKVAVVIALINQFDTTKTLVYTKRIGTTS